MRRWNFQGNILVSNLSEDVTPSELAELFDDYGLVLGVQIKEVVSNANTRIIGLVALAPEPAVEKALAELQGRSLDGRKIKLKKTVAKEKEKPAVPMARPVTPRAAYTTPMQKLPSESEPPRASTAPVRKVVVEYRTAPRIPRAPVSLRPRTDTRRDA